MPVIPKLPVEIMSLLGFYAEYKWRDIKITDQFNREDFQAIEACMDCLRKLRKEIDFYLDAIWG